MVVMDQYTRRIIGFAVHAGNVDGPALCCMFNDATSRQGYYNKYRAHSGRDGATPIKSANKKVIDINEYRWKKHCRGLFELPVAA